MLLFLATMLAGAAGSADLPGVFQATCLDGQAKLSAGEVSPSSFEQLPAAVRDGLGHPASGKVWRFNANGSSYLYMLDYGADTKVCGLVSDTMDMKSAGDLLEARVTGSVARNRPQAAQWINAHDGYVATATTAATFKVLQINWMNAADKEAAQAQVAQLPH